MKKILMFLLLMAVPMVSNAAYKPDANAPRSSIPTIFKWDESVLFKSDGEWESAYKKVEDGIDKLSVFRGKLNSADVIKDCLDKYADVQLLFGKVTLYSNLKNVEDEEVERYQKMRQRGVNLASNFNIKALFIREEILRLDEKTLASLMGDPKLSLYKGYLEDLTRRRKSLLGPEAESVLAILGDNIFAEVDLNELPSDVEMVFKSVTRDVQLPKIKDENGKEVQLTLSNYSKYRSSKDRNIRRETVESFFTALKKYQNIFAATLGGEFKRDVYLANARKYKKAVEAYLDRENIDPVVIDNLIASVHNNLKPLHRYVGLRKKLLNLPDVHIYDLYPPLVPSVESDITYDEAVKDVVSALKPMGEEYSNVLAAAIQPESRWVDVYPNKGKESGAFSSSVWGVHPFVKLNFMNNIDDASTLAHEFGHAMHSYLNAKVQPFVTSGYSTLGAEIASTTNEMLLSKYLLDKYKNDDKMRLYLLGEQVETIRTTIFRQTLFAEFEKKIHEFVEKKEPLTAALFNKTYIDLVKKYYGHDFKIGENDDIEWAYIPHFYWKFYVYSYAAGLASGITFSENIASSGQEGRKLYLNMLKAPSTAKPLDIIKRAGVDLTKPNIVDAAARLMDKAISEMEVIANRIK